MGDLRAGTGGSDVAQPTGKRIARHSAEQVTDQPYVGRRVAAAPGRRRAEPVSEQAPPTFVPGVPAPGRRALRTVEELPVAVNAALLEAPVEVATKVIAPVVEPVAEQTPALAAPPELSLEPIALTTLAASPVGTEPLSEKPVALQPLTHQPQPQVLVTPRRATTGRRAARRRSPVPLPGAPLLMGVAVLAISAGGALQAMHTDADAVAKAHHLAPASALSGSSGVGTASLMGDRAPVLSRSSDRLQASADEQAKQRAEALSGLASQAEKQAQKIKLHAWVLPVAPGAYHLTARFGDYSSLWSSFHTGLDFASSTGTPIMAVAGGTITETGYSGAYGNRTIETLADGTELWYCHQNTFGTSLGATVRPGQVIGYVGSTGNVTGPHLHLEVHPGGGDPVDPYSALMVHGLQP
jgi:murein DD-endopeptidase MepM/ murein hydrolase activator NlpD